MNAAQAVNNLWQAVSLIIIGAVLGASLTLLTSLFLDKRKREQEHLAKLSALLGEIFEIQGVVNGGDRKIRLSHSMWTESRSEIFKIPEGAREALRKLYFKVAQCNSLIEYDLFHSGINQGHFSTIMGVRVNEAKELVGPAIVELEHYIAQRK